ncbi:MAG TPA: phosphate ABC transporter permease subunit PstC [Acidimicrobiales bacterium]|nr:phosphate ABC transporter permease subunit PstC [Acidimicrobiales bacterium]
MGGATAIAEAIGARRGRRAGRVQPAAARLATVLFVAVLGGLLVTVALRSADAIGHFGAGFLTGAWNPSRGLYGAGDFIVGTVAATAVGMVLAVPVGVGAAVFLGEICPARLAGPLAAVVELLAAAPSIVVGLWGLVVLTPLFGRTVEPFLARTPVLDVVFRGPALGASVLLAGVVLAIMVLPTVVALTRTALAGVDDIDREGAAALGATWWQVVRRVVLPGARSGILAAVTLALGRALGETIAVAMVIGNRYAVPHSLLSPAATLPSAIINNFAEATGRLELSAVFGLALVLLVLTALVNVGGQALVRGRRVRQSVAGVPAGERAA